MRKNFTYWRAAHPFLYISIYLFVGYRIGLHFSNSIHFSFLDWILYYTISIVSLLSMTKLALPPLTVSFIVTCCIMSWGIALAALQASPQHSSVPFIDDHFILTCRNWVIEKINKTISHKAANGFALAILLGVKSTMDPTLLNAYKQLGILHIIAISGMHLEILFKNLKRISSILPRSTFFISIEILFLLSTVWIYTFMAFASPSIVRASMLFSIFTIGSAIGSKNFIFNSIAISLCILLIFNAKGLQSIGLQLSYAAVIGIHVLYQPLSTCIPLDNPLIKWMWNNVAMSMAAMLTTLPVLSYHFHQIASWTILSNFVMIPLTNLLLYALVLLLALPMQWGMASKFGNWIGNYINWLNDWVKLGYDHTSASTIKLRMDCIQIAIYYAIIIFVYLWFKTKQTCWLIVVLSLLVGYTIVNLFI